MNKKTDRIDSNKTSPQFYVQRGQKIFGPFSKSQIDRGQIEGKFRDTDTFSETKTGPWSPIPTRSTQTDNIAVAILVPSEEIVTATVVQCDEAEGYVPILAGERNVPPTLSRVDALKWPGPLQSFFRNPVIGALCLVSLIVFAFVLFKSVRRQQAISEEQAEIANANVEQVFTMTTSDWETIQIEGTTDSTVSQQNTRMWEPTDANESFDDFLKRMIGEPIQEPQKALGSTISYTLLSPEHDRLSAEEACDLANDYLYGDKEGPRETSTAYSLLAKASNQGNAKAMLLLSACYSGGWGVEISESMSLHWLEQAAIHRSPEAMYWYAAIIKEGGYPGKGQSDCIYWLTQSARANFQPAVLTLEDFQKRQMSNLISGAILSAFNFGNTENSPPDDNQERWDRREREREYWNERARAAAANRNYGDLEYSTGRVP